MPKLTDVWPKTPLEKFSQEMSTLELVGQEIQLSYPKYFRKKKTKNVITEEDARYSIHNYIIRNNGPYHICTNTPKEPDIDKIDTPFMSDQSYARHFIHLHLIDMYPIITLYYLQSVHILT